MCQKIQIQVRKETEIKAWLEGKYKYWNAVHTGPLTICLHWIINMAPLNNFFSQACKNGFVAWNHRSKRTTNIWYLSLIKVPWYRSNFHCMADFTSRQIFDPLHHENFLFNSMQANLLNSKQQWVNILVNVLNYSSNGAENIFLNFKTIMKRKMYQQ